LRDEQDRNIKERNWYKQSKIEIRKEAWIELNRENGRVMNANTLHPGHGVDRSTPTQFTQFGHLQKPQNYFYRNLAITLPQAQILALTLTLTLTLTRILTLTLNPNLKPNPAPSTKIGPPAETTDLLNAC
jgi:hypothetical protein